MKKKTIVFSFVFAFAGAPLQAQYPFTNHAEAKAIRFAPSQPIIGYTLRVNAADLSSYEVEMKVRNVKDTFRIAMVAHPEYDDRFWRYVVELRGETPSGKAAIVREDSALWRVVAPGGNAVLHYSIKLPVSRQVQRAAWRPFLSPTGGLVGGPHSFLYVEGATFSPSHVTLRIPRGWEIATGLESTSDPETFFAPSVAVLVDSPLLIGVFKSWHFSVDQVPHRVVYWPSPNAIPFDSTILVNSIYRFVKQADVLFGRLPYREYSFLLQDASYGALEHLNSVVLGAPSDQLAKDIYSYLDEIAHEYFHTWNLMRIHPSGYGEVSYTTPPLSSGLWWSEGLTLFYADLLLRRASLPTFDSSRVKHVGRLIQSYYNYPGNSRISPEKVSLAQYGPPGMLGDYSASSHLQGELLGTMMDIIIRDATNGKHSIDEVMRKMLERFGGELGFTGKDIQQLVAEICGCEMNTFFENHVRGSNAIDFNSFLQRIGMRYSLTWEEALNDKGKPEEDLRISAYQIQGVGTIKLLIFNPTSFWGKAGLHTGDQIKTLNGVPVKSAMDFRAGIRGSHIGDKVRIVVQRAGGEFKTTVVVAGYQHAVVRMEEIPKATERQRALRTRWTEGKP